MRPLTLPEYQALENAGRITRPVTDKLIGETTAHRRAADAANSAAHTSDQDRHIRKPGTYPTCGTNHGYVAHERRYEPPCDPCRQARNDVQRQQWAKRHSADNANGTGSAAQRRSPARNGSEGVEIAPETNIATETP